MKVIFILLFLCVLTSCKSQELSNLEAKLSKENNVQSNTTKEIIKQNKPLIAYKDALAILKNNRLKFLNSYNKLTDKNKKSTFLKNIGNYLDNYIVDSILPYWYGTPWDFNGYTNTPNQGVIACGYFVSTTLKHAGLNINRYKPAQQTGLSEALTLSVSEPILDLTLTQNKIADYFIKNMKEGLYFVGLDNHVGYLWFKNKILFFIHSDYATINAVNKEYALSSLAFDSNRYVITPIGNNPKLILKWLKNEKINVILD